jgi:hypothetical protein
MSASSLPDQRPLRQRPNRNGRAVSRRLSPEDLHARLIVTVGVLLAVAFCAMIFVILYGVLFVEQPLNKTSPNDQEAWGIISTTVPYLVGALTGLVAGNGLKSKPKPPTLPEPPQP